MQEICVPFTLFYGSYDEENIIFKDELERLSKQLNLRIVYVLEEHKNEDEYFIGYITHDLLDNVLPENRTELYYFVCGPIEMIEAMENHLLKVGDTKFTGDHREIRNGLEIER